MSKNTDLEGSPRPYSNSPPFDNYEKPQSFNGRDSIRYVLPFFLKY